MAMQNFPIWTLWVVICPTRKWSTVITPTSLILRPFTYASFSLDNLWSLPQLSEYNKDAGHKDHTKAAAFTFDVHVWFHIYHESKVSLNTLADVIILMV